MNEKITSLCMITSKADGSVRSLFRIADLQEGTLIPYSRNSEVAFNDTDRDVLYFPASESMLPDRAIGLYEWESFQSTEGNWRQNVSRLNEQWLEVICTEHDEIAGIVMQLRNGWNMEVYEQRHDLIFACRFMEDTVKCVAVLKSDIQIIKGEYILSESVEHLPVYHIRQEKVVSCKCRKSPSDSRYYLTEIALGAPETTIRTATNEEILSGIFRSELRQIDPLTRKEKQFLLRSLDKISGERFLLEASRRLECPMEDAKKTVEQFLLAIHERVADSNFEQQMLEYVVEHDGKLVQKLRCLVEKEWQDAHASEIQAAKQRVIEQSKQLDVLTERICEAEKRLAEAQTQQSKSEQVKQKVVQLQANIEQQIRNRLQHIRDDKAAAMVEDAFISSVSVDHLRQATEGYRLTYHSTAGCLYPATSSVQETVGLLKEALEDSIVSDGIGAEALSLLLLGGVACRQPLLLAGPKSTILADIIAFAATGHPCAHLQITEDHVLETICSAVSQSSTQIFCISDALTSVYYSVYRDVVDAFPDRRFIFTVRHHESLLLEPASLFADMVPILTGLFVDDSQPLESYCSGDFSTLIACLPSRNECKRVTVRTKWLDDAGLTSLMRNHVVRILGWLEKVGPPVECLQTAVTGLALGYMLCLHQKDDVIAKLLDSAPLPDSIKKAFSSFAGVSAL